MDKKLPCFLCEAEGKKFYKKIVFYMKSHVKIKYIDTQQKTAWICCKLSTNLSILSNWSMSVKIRLVATCNKPVDKKFDNQLATSLLITCNKSVDNLQQVC